MVELTPALKDEEREHPVPTVWRPTLKSIADALAAGNYRLNGIPNVPALDHGSAHAIADQISAYGETLTPLPDESWNRSISSWQEGYWVVLVDLFTVEAGLSDLVLHVHVFEQADGFRYDAHFVYVP